MKRIIRTLTASSARPSVMFGLAVCVVLLSPGRAAADPVTDWNANAGRAAIQACISPSDDPLHESRMYAMMHVAIHDALNAIDRRSRPYAFDAVVNPGASASAAVAAAARDVLVAVIGQIPFPFPAVCLQAGIASVEADYASALAAVPPGPARAAGIAVGQAAAVAILELRAGDGSDTPLLDFAYPQGTKPGDYRFTPGFAFAFSPGWGRVTPFVLNHAAQFRPSPPYRVTSQQYAGFQRGEGHRRRQLDHAEHSHRRRDRGRPVLARKLAAGVEPDCQNRVGQPRPRPLGERAPVRRA